MNKSSVTNIRLFNRVLKKRISALEWSVSGLGMSAVEFAKEALVRDGICAACRECGSATIVTSGGNPNSLTDTVTITMSCNADADIEEGEELGDVTVFCHDGPQSFYFRDGEYHLRDNNCRDVPKSKEAVW